MMPTVVAGGDKREERGDYQAYQLAGKVDEGGKEDFDQRQTVCSRSKWTTRRVIQVVSMSNTHSILCTVALYPMQGQTQ